jgi:hydrogenase nickel incorporation protein HypA/HybF
MHELSIAVSIVDGALEELRRHGAAEATAIYLRVGRLSGVDKDALQFSYGLACQETALEHSRLIIEMLTSPSSARLVALDAPPGRSRS